MWQSLLGSAFPGAAWGRNPGRRYDGLVKGVSATRRFSIGCRRAANQFTE
jgi:hypothetical protein